MQEVKPNEVHLSNSLAGGGLDKIIIKPLILSFERVFCNRTTLILYFLKVYFEGVNTYWHIL